MSWFDYKYFEVLTAVTTAMVVGGLIGFERELANRPAGLRTHMLVSGACALLVAITTDLVLETSGEIAAGALRTDPIRIIDAVVTGVSFICAGTIIRQGEGAVTGLTTAASLLFASATAICIAIGLYAIAVSSALIVLFTLRVIKVVERKWLSSSPHTTSLDDEP